MDAVHSEVVNGLTIKIMPDDASAMDSPVADDEGVIFAYLHRRYENPAAKRTEGDFTTVEGIQAFVNKNGGKRAKWAVFPLFMYEHSARAFRCSEGGNPFIGRAQHAEWDSGRVGIIALKKSEWGKAKSLLTYAQNVCETYTAWANGEVYGYVIEDQNGELVDSCGGYIGYDAVLAEARDMAQAIIREEGAK